MTDRVAPSRPPAATRSARVGAPAGRVVRPGPVHAAEASFAAPVIAQLALVCAGYQIMLTKYVSATLVLLVALAPVIFPVIRRSVIIQIWTALGIAALVSAYILRSTATLPLGATSGLAWGQVLVLATGVAVLLIVVWARSVLPLWRVGLAYGIGIFLASASTSAAFGPTGYKYYFTAPVAIIGLSLADRYGRKLVTAGVAVVLGLAGILDDARSYMGYCVLTAVLLAWMAMRGSSRRRMNRAAPAILIAALAGATYWLATSALTHGFLGADLQTESLAQVDAAGSLIVGGRPEWAATLQLMRVHPTGYGPDVLPSWSEIVEAKQGLQSVGLDITHNGYVDHYMFGDSLNLHSVVADLWAEFGIIGLVLGLLSFGLVVAFMSRRLADRTAGGLAVYAGLVALWMLAFGPIYSDWRDVCFAVAVLAPLRFALADGPPPGDDAVPPALRRRVVVRRAGT